jgi:hypothetical protein
MYNVGIAVVRKKVEENAGLTNSGDLHSFPTELPA